MKKMYLIYVNARKAMAASRLHWLELEYVAFVLKECEDYCNELRTRLRESESELEYDMLWEDYRSDIKLLLYFAELRGCSNDSLAKIESWLLY